MKGPLNVTVAVISIFLYSSLACVCIYFALSFWDFETGRLSGGRFGATKLVFFIVLGTSAILDTPLFIWCAALGGPASCEWNAPSYEVLWLFHLCANCGYVYAIIVPPVLWSDIIQHKDGHFWNSSSPLDPTKVFFRASFLLYCANELFTIIGAIAYMNPSNTSAYSESNVVGTFSNCLTPAILTTITFGCLSSGIRLQRHVMKVGLGSAQIMKILMHLNITLFVITTTYLARALLVLSLWTQMPSTFRDFLSPITGNYIWWVVGSRWAPAVCCSFLLVNEMRFKGDLRSRSKELSRAWTESGDSLPTISLYRTDSEVNSSTKLLGDFGEYGDDDVFGLGRGRSEEGVGEEREGKEGREGGDGEGSEGEGGVRPHSYHAHMSLLRTFTSGTGSEGSDRDRFGYGGGDGDEGDEGGEVDEGEHHPRLREQQQQTLGAGSRPMFIPHQGPRSDNRDRDRDRETRESRDSRGNRDSVSLNDMFGSPRSGDRLDHFFAAAALQARSSISQQRGSEGQSRSRVQSESQGQGQGQGDSGGSGGPRLVDGGDVMVDDSLEGGS